MAEETTAPEFSRLIDLDRIGQTEVLRDIGATLAERAALARRLGIPAIARLEAQIRLRREQAGTLVRLTGHLVADVTQTCVVTLVPVDNHIDHDFTLLYGAVPAATAVDLDADTEDVLEPWPEGPLDIGEAVAQELSLALDPYPRAPGAVSPDWQGPDAVPKKVNPFAGLEKLRRRLT